MIINTVKIWGSGYIANEGPLGQFTDTPSDELYIEIMAWIAAGNIPDPQYTVSQELDISRQTEIQETTQEGLSRISLLEPRLVKPLEVPPYEAPDLLYYTVTPILELMDVLWAGINTGSLDPDIVLAKDIYDYMQSMILWETTATLSELDAYDATTDPNWPS